MKRDSGDAIHGIESVASESGSCRLWAGRTAARGVLTPSNSALGSGAGTKAMGMLAALGRPGVRVTLDGDGAIGESKGVRAAVLNVFSYRFGATLRRRWGGYLAIALLVGLVGGIAMGSIAAARRTQSSYPAFLASTNASQLTMSTYGVTGNSAANNYSPQLTRTDRTSPGGQAGRGLGWHTGLCRWQHDGAPNLNGPDQYDRQRGRPVFQRGPSHPRRRPDGGPTIGPTSSSPPLWVRAYGLARGSGRAHGRPTRQTSSE